MLSEPILTEVGEVLITRPHLRTRYRYTDLAVADYVNGLRRAATLVSELPDVSVVRDRSDDVILATALAASARYLCSRDRDLLDLQRYREIAILSPEDLLSVLRAGRVRTETQSITERKAPCWVPACLCSRASRVSGTG